MEHGDGADENERRRREMDAQDLRRRREPDAIDDLDRGVGEQRRHQRRGGAGGKSECGETEQRVAQLGIGARRGKPGGDRQEHLDQRPHDGLRGLEQACAGGIVGNVGERAQQAEQGRIDPELDHGEQAKPEQRQGRHDHPPPDPHGRPHRPEPPRLAPAGADQPKSGDEVDVGDRRDTGPIADREPDAGRQHRQVAGEGDRGHSHTTGAIEGGAVGPAEFLQAAIDGDRQKGLALAGGLRRPQRRPSGRDRGRRPPAVSPAPRRADAMCAPASRRSRGSDRHCCRTR